MSNPLSSNCPAFDKSIITDGDNVESTEFEAGFGGTAKDKKEIPAKPFPYKKLTADEKKHRDWFFMTDEEKKRIESAHLTKHGIEF